jgi:Ni/Co efflux regulator RcnB
VVAALTAVVATLTAVVATLTAVVATLTAVAATEATMVAAMAAAEATAMAAVVDRHQDAPKVHAVADHDPDLPASFPRRNVPRRAPVGMRRWRRVSGR